MAKNEGKQAEFRKTPGKLGDGKKAQLKESKFRNEAGSTGNANNKQSVYRNG